MIGLATLMIPTTVAATLSREVVQGQGSNLYLTAFRKFLHHEWYGIHPVTVRITAPTGAKFDRDVCSRIKATYKYSDYGNEVINTRSFISTKTIKTHQQTQQ
ncbi:hypothetical protein D6O12_25205 [Salmonella enterica]|nr:hypothetical protein [Salmonella enterica]